MRVLFVGGTAEQCIASAVLQQKGVHCDVICAGGELGTPWVSISLEAILAAGDAGELDPTNQYPGLSVLFVESVKEKIKDARPASLTYECVTEVLALNSPLILLSSVANMSDYYRFIYVEEPLIVYKERVLHAPTCISSLMKSEAYAMVQRRNMLRFLKTMEHYLKVFHLSYVTLTDREDAGITYTGLPDELFVLQRLEKENATIADIATYFKVPLTFFSQLLLVPEASLDHLAFADLLRGVVNLFQSLHGHNNNRSRCVLEYGLSDIVQSFIRLLFSYGGLGLAGCSVEVQNEVIKVNPQAGEAVLMTPNVIYLCDRPITTPSIQTYFLLRDDDGAMASALRKHVYLIDEGEGDDASNERHAQLNFTCIMSDCVAIVRIGEGIHLKRGFISVLAQPVPKRAVVGASTGEEEDPLSTACGVRDTVRRELPVFMGLSTDQLQAAECAVVGTYYDSGQLISKLSPFTPDQLTMLENHCEIRRYSAHQVLSLPGQEKASVSDVLTHTTAIIKEVLEMSPDKVEWVQDLRRSQCIDGCRRLFLRQKSTEKETNLDEFERSINSLVDQMNEQRARSTPTLDGSGACPLP